MDLKKTKTNQPWLRYLGLGLCGVALFVGCFHVGRAMKPKAFDQRDVTALKAGLTPAWANVDPVASEEERRYVEMFDMPHGEADWSWRKVPSQGYDIAVQRFLPQLTTPHDKAKGTVVVIHGYYDHVAMQRNVIKRCLSQGYAVVALDLPGHGLSSGSPATIDDMRVYGKVLGDVLKQLTDCPGPYFAVAHSMGSISLYDVLQDHVEPPISRAVLMAPLVKSAHWDVTQLGMGLLGAVADDIPRVFRDNSHDKAFVKRMKQDDPFQHPRVPMAWVKALRDYQAHFDAQAPTQHPVLIIQGTGDSTVSWKDNLDRLRKRFPQSRVLWVEGAKHHLSNEAKHLREPVLEGMMQFFNETDGVAKAQ